MRDPNEIVEMQPYEVYASQFFYKFGKEEIPVIISVDTHPTDFKIMVRFAEPNDHDMAFAVFSMQLRAVPHEVEPEYWQLQLVTNHAEWSDVNLNRWPTEELNQGSWRLSEPRLLNGPAAPYLMYKLLNSRGLRFKRQATSGISEWKGLLETESEESNA